MRTKSEKVFLFPPAHALSHPHNPSPVVCPHTHNIILPPPPPPFCPRSCPLMSLGPIKTRFLVFVCVYLCFVHLFVVVPVTVHTLKHRQSGEQLLPIASPASSSCHLACFVAPAPAPVSYSTYPKEEQTQSSFFVQCVWKNINENFYAARSLGGHG